MNTDAGPVVLSVVEARTRLPEIVAGFRREGPRARPVVLGRHRRPEAVVVPFDTWAQMMDALDDADAAATVRARATGRTAQPLDVEQLADEVLGT